MKIVIDMAKEKYEWIKENNPNANPDSIVGAVANGTPYDERPQGEWLASDIRWTDKVSVKSNGDIIDFNGQVVGHINLEILKGGVKNE